MRHDARPETQTQETLSPRSQTPKLPENSGPLRGFVLLRFLLHNVGRAELDSKP